MATDWITQLTFEGDRFPKPTVVAFDQECGSSDGGLILLQALDAQLGLTDALTTCLRDARPSATVPGRPQQFPSVPIIVSQVTTFGSPSPRNARLDSVRIAVATMSRPGDDDRCQGVRQDVNDDDARSRVPSATHACTNSRLRSAMNSGADEARDRGPGHRGDRHDDGSDGHRGAARPGRFVRHATLADLRPRCQRSGRPLLAPEQRPCDAAGTGQGSLGVLGA
jgi:hypothetical protein